MNIVALIIAVLLALLVYKVLIKVVGVVFRTIVFIVVLAFVYYLMVNNWYEAMDAVQNFVSKIF